MKYIVAISIILLQFGCSPAKRMARQQAQYQKLVDEYIKNHPPRIDTATIYLKGFDSSTYFKHLADSVAATKMQTTIEVQMKYKDTCTTAIDTYNEGFNLGYEIGKADGKATASTRVDTLLQTVVPTEQISLLNKDNHQLQLDIAAEKNNTLKAKAKSSTWLIFLIISVCANGLLTFFIIKK
jgi:hypothetical protein